MSKIPRDFEKPTAIDGVLEEDHPESRAVVSQGLMCRTILSNFREIAATRVIALQESPHRFCLVWLDSSVHTLPAKQGILVSVDL